MQENACGRDLKISWKACPWTPLHNTHLLCWTTHLCQNLLKSLLVYSLKPCAEVCCLQLNFKISKLAYSQQLCRVLINSRWLAKKPASSSIELPTFPGSKGWWDKHSIAKLPTFKSELCTPKLFENPGYANPRCTWSTLVLSHHHKDSNTNSMTNLWWKMMSDVSWHVRKMMKIPLTLIQIIWSLTC